MNRPSVVIIGCRLLITVVIMLVFIELKSSPRQACITQHIQCIEVYMHVQARVRGGYVRTHTIVRWRRVMRANSVPYNRESIILSTCLFVLEIHARFFIIHGRWGLVQVGTAHGAVVFL